MPADLEITLLGTSHNVRDRVHCLGHFREVLAHYAAEILRDHGWKRSSDFPGSLWLWSKDFPESHIQSRRRGPSAERTPYPARSYCGVSTDVALTIEHAWQERYDDARSLPELPEDD